MGALTFVRAFFLYRFFFPFKLTVMESFTLDLFPNAGQVHIALFKNVSNASELKQRLANQDATLKCALVDASYV